MRCDVQITVTDLKDYTQKARNVPKPEIESWTISKYISNVTGHGIYTYQNLTLNSRVQPFYHKLNVYSASQKI